MTSSTYHGSMDGSAEQRMEVAVLAARGAIKALTKLGREVPPHLQEIASQPLPEDRRAS